VPAKQAAMRKRFAEKAPRDKQQAKHLAKQQAQSQANKRKQSTPARVVVTGGRKSDPRRRQRAANAKSSALSVAEAHMNRTNAAIDASGKTFTLNPVPRGKMPPKAKAKGGPATGGVKKPHRYRPGTVAMREIRRYQKTSNLLIPKLPFQRVVRDVAMNYQGDLRFQGSAVMALQEATEAYVVRFMEDALIACLHRKCVTIMPADFLLVKKIRGMVTLHATLQELEGIVPSDPQTDDSARPMSGFKRVRKVIKRPIQGITKPSIRRLARRGGVKRIGGLIYQETRALIQGYLQGVIQDATIYTTHARRKTVTAMDVVYALKRQGSTLYGFGN